MKNKEEHLRALINRILIIVGCLILAVIFFPNEEPLDSKREERRLDFITESVLKESINISAIFYDDLFFMGDTKETVKVLVLESVFSEREEVLSRGDIIEGKIVKYDEGNFCIKNISFDKNLTKNRNLSYNIVFDVPWKNCLKGYFYDGSSMSKEERELILDSLDSISSYRNDVLALDKDQELEDVKTQLSKNYRDKEVLYFPKGLSIDLSYKP